jgi:hypothetical protein
MNNNRVSMSFIQAVFESRFVRDLAALPQTHDAGRDFVAQIVTHTKDAGLIRALVESALPENSMSNTPSEVPDMVRGALEKGFDKHSGGTAGAGDGGEEEGEPSHAQIVMHLLTVAGMELFHDNQRRSFMAMPQADGGTRYWGIRSSDCRAYCRQVFFKATKKPISGQALHEALETLAAKALFEGKEREVHLRVGGDGTKMAFDLGRADGNIVMIDRNGWRVGVDATFVFYQSPSMRELPLPGGPGGLAQLQELVGLSDDQWLLVLAFLLSALRPSGPYFVLMVEGEQGSGKSKLCEIIKRIIDPNALLKMALPEDARGLMVMAKEFHLPVFDNVSGMKGDMSDALCSLATGGGVATRRLYTDDELQIFTFSRPFILNGISDFASRPDLMERGIPLRLVAMRAGARRPESEMDKKLDAILPDILFDLFNATVRAMAGHEDVELTVDVRMADAARWVQAAEPALDVKPGSLLNAVVSAQNELMVDRVQNEPVVVALEKILIVGPFEGTVGELHAKMANGEGRFDRFMPATPSHLSKQLARLKPAMKRAGIIIAHGPKTKLGKTLRISREGPDAPKVPAYAKNNVTIPVTLVTSVTLTRTMGRGYMGRWDKAWARRCPSYAPYSGARSVTIVTSVTAKYMAGAEIRREVCTRGSRRENPRYQPKYGCRGVVLANHNVLGQQQRAFICGVGENATHASTVRGVARACRGVARFACTWVADVVTRRMSLASARNSQGGFPHVPIFWQPKGCQS